jgi:hypothetical protein
MTLVEAVKAHAISNYAVDGWDIVVECYDDSELLDIIAEAGAATEAEAIAAVGAVVGLIHEVRADIQGS